jgi:MFS family permease
MRAFKSTCFLLEGLNSLSTTYYFYYIYFFAEAKFGFGKLENLVLAAGLGLSYAAASAFGGKLAQKWGYLETLGLGSVLMGLAQLVGAGADSLLVHLGVMAVAVFGMGMTWPALQALATDGEDRRRMQTMVGIYNLVWSLAGALAYLTGGAMLESWGLRSLFIVPAAMNAGQVLIILLLRRSHRHGRTVSMPEPGLSVTGETPPRGVNPRAFLRMAWFANPFAYLTINTVVAFGPVIAKSLSLSPRYAGYFCSVWMFIRTASFVLLWLWPAWHYRFRWMVAAYVGMMLTFVSILLAPNVPALVLAQIGFGFSIGLIYYSSLFYSMDVGETKGEHGGIHEAAIGLGSSAGPALGATILYLAPQVQHATPKAVGVVLMLGLIGLLWLRRRES